MLLAAKTHTVGDARRWTIDYARWLANTATIASVTLTSSSTSLTLQPTPSVLGDQVVFFLVGGTLGERVTVTVTMTDSLGNIKHDTLSFTVVAP